MSTSSAGNIKLYDPYNIIRMHILYCVDGGGLIVNVF